MADNIEQLIEVPDTEKVKNSEELENVEKLSKQNIDLTNLVAILRTAGESATKLLFERILAKKK